MKYYVICGLLIVCNVIFAADRGDWDQVFAGGDSKGTTKPNIGTILGSTKKSPRKHIKHDNEPNTNEIKTEENIQELANTNENIQRVNDNPKECPLKKYEYIFQTSWQEKDITLDKFQHEKLGGKNATIKIPFTTYNLLGWTDYDKAKYYIDNMPKNGDNYPNGINGRINLSVLRCIVEAMKIELNKKDFGRLFNLFDSCVLNNVHYWTSPVIDRNIVEANKNDMTKTINNQKLLKNDVQKSFKNTRDVLFDIVTAQLIKFASSIKPFADNITKIEDNQEVLTKDTIKEIKDLYALTVMAYKMHNETFEPSKVVVPEFSNTQESNILQIVTPEDIEDITAIKEALKAIKTLATGIGKNTENILNRSRKDSNWEKSIIISKNT